MAMCASSSLYGSSGSRINCRSSPNPVVKYLDHFLFEGTFASLWELGLSTQQVLVYVSLWRQTWRMACRVGCGPQLSSRSLRCCLLDSQVRLGVKSAMLGTGAGSPAVLTAVPRCLRSQTLRRSAAVGRFLGSLRPFGGGQYVERCTRMEADFSAQSQQRICTLVSLVVVLPPLSVVGLLTVSVAGASFNRRESFPG